MSLISNRSQKLKKLKSKSLSNDIIFSFSSEDKKLDFNTISTIEKERLSKYKTVSFKGIEIIEVESYKKYNQIPILTLESFESNCIKAYEECKCDIF